MRLFKIFLCVFSRHPYAIKAHLHTSVAEQTSRFLEGLWRMPNKTLKEGHRVRKITLFTYQLPRLEPTNGSSHGVFAQSSVVDRFKNQLLSQIQIPRNR